MTRTRVCFATPGVWPLVAGEPAIYGGSELRALAFLRGLAGRSLWHLSLIVFARSAAPAPELDVEIVADRYHAGQQSWLERLADRLQPAPVSAPAPSVTAGEARAWRRADAALYVAFGVADYTAKLAAWCRRNGRRLVLVAGSDSDFDERYRADDPGRNSYGSRNALCRYAIEEATTVICQTSVQAELLASRFGRTGAVVRNPVELGSPLAGARRAVLWLGKTDAVKRPELFSALARLCPDIPFVLVANPTDRARLERLRAAAPPNLEIRERVARADINRLVADSFCLVNTSVFEGFPNAFLDAARQAVPVLTLAVDPEGALERSGGGAAHGGELGALAATVRRLHQAPDEARAMGARWREHVATHHAAEPQIAAFDAELRRTLGLGAVEAA